MNLRVLHVIESLDDQAGSLAYVVHDLVAELPACGIAAAVAVMGAGATDVPAAFRGVEVSTLDGGSGRAALRRTLGNRIGDADVIHLHGPRKRLIRVAASLACRARVPYVLSPHQMWAPNPLKRLEWRRKLTGFFRRDRMLQRAACLHAGSRNEERLLRQRGFEGRVELIRLGVCPGRHEQPPDTDALHQEVPELADRRCLLSLGPVHPAEGLAPLLRACEDLADTLDGWQLVLAGPAEDRWREQTEAAVRRRGETDHVTLIIAPDADRQAALLARADLLVQPSLREQVPVASLQAMAAGVPVVLSTCCDLPEVETERAGLVAEPNRRSLREALERALNGSDEQRREMGNNGKALIREKFNSKHLAPRFAELYRCLAGQGR